MEMICKTCGEKLIMHKKVLWHFRMPGMGLYCNDLRFDKPVSEKEARASLRARDGYKRLPKYTEFW